MENPFIALNWVQKLPIAFKQAWSFLNEYIKENFNINFDNLKEIRIQMPFLADTRSQWGIDHVEKFVSHIKSVISDFENKYNSEVDKVFYCYWEIFSSHWTLISNTMIGFDEFILRNSWDHTLFCGFVILKNWIIIKMSDYNNPHSAFDDYYIYS